MRYSIEIFDPLIWYCPKGSIPSELGTEILIGYNQITFFKKRQKKNFFCLQTAYLSGPDRVVDRSESVGELAQHGSRLSTGHSASILEMLSFYFLLFTLYSFFSRFLWRVRKRS